jgi:hypothetical protein
MHRAFGGRVVESRWQSVRVICRSSDGIAGVPTAGSEAASWACCFAADTLSGPVYGSWTAARAAAAKQLVEAGGHD